MNQEGLQQTSRKMPFLLKFPENPLRVKRNTKAKFVELGSSLMATPPPFLSRFLLPLSRNWKFVLISLYILTHASRWISNKRIVFIKKWLNRALRHHKKGIPGSCISRVERDRTRQPSLWTRQICLTAAVKARRALSSVSLVYVKTECLKDLFKALNHFSWAGASLGVLRRRPLYDWRADDWLYYT